jgi:hypothetical protein
MLGNQVCTLKDSELLPGAMYTCRIGTKAYRAGVYVVRMAVRGHSASFSQSKRIIVE